MASSGTIRTGPLKQQRTAPAIEARPILVAQKARASVAFETGDLLAIPLCILWGAGLWLAKYLPAGVLPGSDGLATGIEFMWNLPVTIARYLFGG